MENNNIIILSFDSQMQTLKRSRDDISISNIISKKVYERYPERIAVAIQVVQKPLTLAEKFFTLTFGKVTQPKRTKEEILM